MKASGQTLISIVVPCYNEQAVIAMCHRRISDVVAKIQDCLFEIIYVNDGSRDQTLSILADIQKSDPRIRVVDLSRNFGKEAALTAGLDTARGDAVIILDADLQDPPELIPDLMAVWQETGADVVYGQRTSRLGETWLKKFSASAFYKIINRISGRVTIPYNTGDFRLMNRRALDALAQLREHHRFMKGLFAWIGYRQVAFPYVRAPRAAGRTKWDYISLWNFSLEGITGFSMTPLRLAGISGFVISILSFVFGCYILLKTLVSGSSVPGYPSLMIMITFLSGIQLLTIGILGEYIGRIFNETKRRPLYFIDKIHETPLEGRKGK